MRKRTVWIVGVLGLAMLAWAAGSGEAAQQEIKIGFTISTSGTFARAAEPVRRGILLYEDWINKQGGIMVKDLGRKLPVKMVFYDDESNKDNVLRLYERLGMRQTITYRSLIFR